MVLIFKLSTLCTFLFIENCIATSTVASGISVVVSFLRHIFGQAIARRVIVCIERSWNFSNHELWVTQCPWERLLSHSQLKMHWHWRFFFLRKRKSFSFFLCCCSFFFFYNVVRQRNGYILFFFYVVCHKMRLPS